MNDFEKYGRHLPGCKFNVSLSTQFFYGKKRGECDCGFLEALKRAKVADNKPLHPTAKKEGK